MSTRRSGSSSRRLRPHRAGSTVAAPLILALAVLAAACTDGAGGPGGGDDRAATPPPEAEPSTVATTEPAEAPSSGGAPGSTTTPDRFEVEPAAWAACHDRFECATVTVPLDHARPDGETIDLALIRVPAAGAAAEARDGHVPSIFVNPGGPGGSGFDQVRNGFRLDDDTMTRFHLVGFDPRGIGASAPLSCDPSLVDEPRPDFSPDDAAEASALDTDARAVAEACAASDGPKLPHLGTDAVVDDLDLLRQAVGDQQLHYMGLSYGTVIGMRYAHRYPTTVGHLVLDGVVDPAFGLADLLRQQADAFERAFLVLDQACGVTITCPEGGAAAGYDRLAVELERSGPREGVGTTELDIATLLTLYSEQLWPRYAEALAAAEAGDYRPIERLHDLYATSTNFAAYLAVSCIDSPTPRSTEGWDALVRELAERAPRFGSTLGNELRSCAFWPAEPTGQPEPASGADLPPVLVLSTTGDAATPLVNATRLADALPGAGLAVVDDTGHTAYGRNFCITAIVSAYFDRGVVPPEPHRC